MGSIVRYSNLEAFERKFGEKIRNYYQSILDLTVVSMSEVDYYIRADVTLSDGTLLDTHYRWATEEEEELEIEIKQSPEDLTATEYFESYVMGKVIEKIETGFERDDNFYAYVVVEGGGNIEVPIYFDPEGLELGSNSIISDEEFQEFVIERINR